MDKVFQIATNISTPLMLAGFFAAAFFFIIRQIIKANIFPQLARHFAGDIIKIIVERFFVLALIAMILGFAGYIIEKLNPAQPAAENPKEHYEFPANELIKIRLQDITAVDLLPKPESKNVTISLKTVPKSKTKYVPLKAKGQLIIIDSTGAETAYIFDANLDDEGVKPQVTSYIILDGLIPRQLYEQIILRNNFKAKCTVYYDSDVIPTQQEFTTPVFSFDKNTINDLSSR